MMRTIILVSLLCSLACTFPSKEDIVRENRWKYEITQDFVINDEEKTLTLEIKVKNLAGTLKLQDLTVDLKGFSETDEVLWSKRMTLDVSDISEYSTKVFPFKETIENAPEIQKLLVIQAPDDPGSGFETYPEFLRIIQ